MPHQPIHQTATLRRPARRGFDASLAGNKLTITVQPPTVWSVGVAAGSGMAVRLQDGAGANLATSGVVVSLLFNGGGVSLLGTATTDGSGVATFGNVTINAAPGVYQLVFTANAYASALANNRTVIAGPAAASRTTASVPNGTVGFLSTVFINAKDTNGNPLNVGGSTFLVVVTGANPHGSTAATDLGTGTYQYTYTPAATGTDTVAITLGGVAISGSPYSASVTGSGSTGGFGPTSLYVGLNNNLDILGKGPATSGGSWLASEPIWRKAQGQYDVSSIAADIAFCDSKNILMVNVMTGARGNWTTRDANGKSIPDMAKFQATINKYAGNSAVTSALARRRMIVFVVDEPWIDDFGGQCTPAFVRDMARYIKGIWPNCITFARMEPEYMRGGWDGSGTLAVNFFDKLDYANCTWRSSIHSPTTGMTIAQGFAAGKASNTAAGYGTVLGFNWLNLGEPDCWGYLNTSALGRIHGDNSSTGQRGTATPCSAGVGSENFWGLSPDMIRAVGVEAAKDFDCPFLGAYVHCYPSFLRQIWKSYEQRSDYEVAFQDLVRSCEGRTTWNGWRNPK